jgi:hypothetical protein
MLEAADKSMHSQMMLLIGPLPALCIVLSELFFAVQAILQGEMHTGSGFLHSGLFSAQLCVPCRPQQVDLMCQLFHQPWHPAGREQP